MKTNADIEDKEKAFEIENAKAEALVEKGKKSSRINNEGAETIVKAQE